MSPPTERFKKLSLESSSMPPTTRLQSRLQHVDVPVEEDSSSSSSSSSDRGCSEPPDFEIDEDEEVMVSPSRLKYSLDLLDDETRENVVKATEVPSQQFVLRGCQAGDQRCLFLITEPVEYTVRTGSEGSGYGVPSCTCEESDGRDSPCRHVLWLFDQITNQVLGVKGESPYTLTRHGYPAELGNPYDAVADFHLDMLADGLHCDVVGQSPDPNPRRVRETREMLASLNEVSADEYRPDLFTDDDNNPARKGSSSRRRTVVTRGDLEQTIFRMLVRNDDFFRYFSSSMRVTDEREHISEEARFRGLGLRADAALVGLKQYADSDASSHTDIGQRPKDVAWCATHLVSVARQIRAVIHATTRPLSPRELRAAARVAVGMLARVVFDFDYDIDPADLAPDHRNLYRRLIGTDAGGGFAVVLDILASIPPEVFELRVVDDLSAIERRIAEKQQAEQQDEDDEEEENVPATYTFLARLRSLLAHLRVRSSATRSIAGSKRGGSSQAHAQGRGKRAR